jgi:hypothetical protein
MSPVGAKTIARYENLSEPRALLASHRPDGLANLKAVTLLTWADLGGVLTMAMDTTRRCDERNYAKLALAWLDEKGLLASAASKRGY